MATILVGICIPRPPIWLAGRLVSVQRSLRACLPMIAGREWSLITFSSGCNPAPISGMVCMRKLYLLDRPQVKTACLCHTEEFFYFFDPAGHLVMNKFLHKRCHPQSRSQDLGTLCGDLDSCMMETLLGCLSIVWLNH